MCLHNKFLSFLIGCTITNSCFCVTLPSGVTGPNNWGNSYIDPGIIFEPDFDPILFPTCDKGYYIAQCGDIYLNLDTILAYVKLRGLDAPGCWAPNDDHYADMRRLLHLKQNEYPDYDDTNNPFQSQVEACDIKKFQTLRKQIFTACLNSTITCVKCPNGGTTDESVWIPAKTGETEENYSYAGDEYTAADTPYWISFNTIADCYTQSGSDNKGTFTVVGNTNETDKCYYNY